MNGGWGGGEKQKLEAMIKSVSAKLEAYPLLPSLVPEIVHLNMTTGAPAASPHDYETPAGVKLTSRVSCVSCVSCRVSCCVLKDWRRVRRRTAEA